MQSTPLPHPDPELRLFTPPALRGWQIMAIRRIRAVQQR